MATERLTLLCKIEHDEALKENHDLFWKTCTWTRLSDGAECHLTALEHKTNIESCDVSMGDVEHTITDRLECSITLPNILKIDDGAWKCKLTKCVDRKDGGCSSNITSTCYREIIVNATVYDIYESYYCILI